MCFEFRFFDYILNLCECTQKTLFYSKYSQPSRQTLETQLKCKLHDCCDNRQMAIVGADCGEGCQVKGVRRERQRERDRGWDSESHNNNIIK